MGSESPNPMAVGISVLQSMRVRKPAPSGHGVVSHDGLAQILDVLKSSGVPGIAARREQIRTYRESVETVDPDSLDRAEALAFWLNLYNAGALDVAAETAAAAETTVLRVPGAFRRDWAVVAGETLSLDDIEHGKIRRFRDPRIHGALVCGSASCPTLRYEPYGGACLDEQLEAQMKSFLAGGGAVYDAETNRLQLSRILLWYGADFARPQRMPAWLPVSKKRVAGAIVKWLDVDVLGGLDSVSVEFQSYDWGLSCSIG